MNDRMPAAFVLSLSLHGAMVVLLLAVGYVASRPPKLENVPFELVQGEGDNFAATEAPKLGIEGGLKVPISVPPMPQPETIKAEPAKPEPEPVKPEPMPEPVAPPPPKAPPTKAPAETKPKSSSSSTKTLAQEMNWKQVQAESAAKRKLAAEKKAEKKKQDMARADAARLAASATKSPRIDAEGIAKGVRDGSAANKVGGAGGTALSRTEGPVLDAYFAMLRERLLKALDKPPGLSDTLVAEAEFRLNADGSISGVSIIGPSGSTEFDRAVLDAFKRTRMPARPDGKSSVQTTRFRTKDLEGN